MNDWNVYLDANPMLAEMREYNTRVRDRVVLGKTKKLTAPPYQATEFMDRYKAMGLPYPDPKTMCHGACDGTGLVPIKGRGWGMDRGDDHKDQMGATASVDGASGGPSSEDDRYQKLWDAAEKKSPTDDGWHFVKCLDCGGTGKRTSEESLNTCIRDLRNLVG